MMYRAKLEFFLPDQPMFVIEQRRTRWLLLFPYTTYEPIERAILRSDAIELCVKYGISGIGEMLDRMATEHWEPEVNNS